MIFIPETTSLTIGVGRLGSMLKRSGQGICSRLDKRRLDSQNFSQRKNSWEICYKDKESEWKNILHMRWCNYLKSFLDLHHIRVLVFWCVVPVVLQFGWSLFDGVSSERVSALLLPAEWPHPSGNLRLMTLLPVVGWVDLIYFTLPIRGSKVFNIFMLWSRK